jgi:hypothetical protein
MNVPSRGLLAECPELRDRLMLAIARRDYRDPQNPGALLPNALERAKAIFASLGPGDLIRLELEAPRVAVTTEYDPFARV